MTHLGGSIRRPHHPSEAHKLAGRGHLFNLNDDPAETNNLAAKMPEKLAEMSAKFESIRNLQAK